MCKSTKGTQSGTTARLLDIRKEAAGGGGGNGGGGGSVTDAEAGLPGPIFGAPDFAPQHTFIAQATPTDNGFIATANQFHTLSGLSPRTVVSVQDMVEKLADPTETGSGTLNRIRLVTHSFFDDSGLGDPTNMKLPFLTGGTRSTLKRHFDGFAQGPIAGLKAMMTFEVGTFTNTTIFIHAGSGSDILGALGSAHAAIVAKFPRDALGDLGEPFNEFVRLCGSVMALNRGAMSQAASAGAVTALRAAYGRLIDDAIPRLAPTITAAEAGTIRSAIEAVTSGTIATQTPFGPADYAVNLERALAVTANNTFQTTLAAVRQRLNQASKVDIRGCQVGRDPDFLRAVRRFFGTDATRRPTVSAPQWFQHFVPIGHVSARTNAHVATLHASGPPGFAAQLVRDSLAAWADAYRVDAAHLAAWTAATGLNVLAFNALAWRTTIPATTVPVAQLTVLATEAYADAMRRIAAIFLLAAAEVPTAAQLTAAEPLSANGVARAGQLTNPIADTDPPATLQTRFDQLKAIYEDVDRRFGSGTPPTAAQRVIPATAPNPLTAAGLRTLQTALRTFVDTNANSRLRPIRALMTTVAARLADAPARMRYYLGIGLPFLIQTGGDNRPADSSRIVCFEDQSGSFRRQKDAAVAWVRSHWRGLVPADAGANATFPDLTFGPWLCENRQPNPVPNVPPFRISPTQAFQDRIVTILAGDP